MDRIVNNNDGTIVDQIFSKFFLVHMCVCVCVRARAYMYVLILAICFNKFALYPLNNIIDLFKGHKNFY